jgi:hypothetical protein
MTNKQHPSIEEGAAAATASLGFPIAPSDIAALIELGVLPHVTAKASAATLIRVADACRLGAQVHALVQIGGLFDETPGLFPHPGSEVGRPNPSSYSQKKPLRTDAVFLGLSPMIGISYTPAEVPAEAVQVFIALLRSGAPSNSDPTLCEARPPVPVDLDPHATLWVMGEARPERFRSLWARAVRREAATSFTESLATAKIYGNKARLTSFLMAVAGLHLPEGSTVCDLMAGTGIVALRLADHYRVYANDANPFAAHLTRCRSAFLSGEQASATLEAVRLEQERNASALRAILADLLEAEACFFHGVVNAETLARYRAFCDSFPPPFPADLPAADGGAEDAATRLCGMVRDRRQQPQAFPYCLATAYYSNAYLGLAQSIAADGIRAAIDRRTQGGSRDLCLGALFLAVSSCCSGPHFAQPPKLNTETAMKEVVEHRARDLFAEFAMIFRLLSTRDPRSRQIERIWNGDWRDALTAFDAETAGHLGQSRAVYVDPPYTKLQYSRYYHVLNTLLRYNYPPCEGVGRYPPRSDRFSSKFEFQPAAAAREFGELFDRCSDLRLVTLVSYSNRGFVPLGDLAALMERRFRAVEVYSKPSQHHSQGKPLSSASKSVCEYVLVGLP